MAGIGGGVVTGAAVGAGVADALGVAAGLAVGFGVALGFGVAVALALGFGVALDFGLGVGVGVCFDFFFFFFASGCASLLISARQRACPGLATGHAGWKSMSTDVEIAIGGSETATGAPQAPIPNASENAAKPTLNIRAPRIREPLPSPVV